MTDDTNSTFVPRAPRFKVDNASEAVVTVTRSVEGEDRTLPAELVDISQHGVKMRVPVNLRFEEAVQLQIDVAGTELEYHGVASVRHIRSVDEEHWLVGCAIAPPMSDETFSYLATTAGKERRRFRRLPISAEATVRRQAQTEGTAATIHNLSSGGICFSSDAIYEVGERVQLFVDDPDGKQRVVEARICWQIDGADGSIAGCKFSTSNSYAELCACLTEQPALISASKAHTEPTSKLVLTAAVLAMFVPPMMTLLMQANKVSAEAGAAAPIADAIVDREIDMELAEPNSPDEQLDANLLEELVAESTAQENQPDEAIGPTEPEPAPAVEQPGLREWVDNTGKHRTQALLAEVGEDYVVLRKPDGRETKVPWRRLSAADQQFARDWQTQQESVTHEAH